MLYLSKILAQLAHPLALGLLLMPCGLLLRRRWPRLGLALAGVGFAWLWIWSLPVASLWLRAGLEQRYAQTAAADYPVAEAIVVLGGSIEGPRLGWRAGANLLAAADRLWFAMELYRAGRAPTLVLSGGTAQWSTSDQPEAETMADFLAQAGVPRAAMLLDSDSLTTHENALRTQQILAAHGIRRVLLVTSALHMRRALATFARAGIDAIAAPTDFEAVPRRGASVLQWIPDVSALEGSTRALKEYAGLWIYRLQGWATET